MLELLILAAVAIAVLYRLYVTLGRHGGAPTESRSASAPDASPSGVASANVPAADNVARLPSPVVSDVKAEEGLRAIAAEDAAFDPGAFLDGARAAYHMIVDAYARGEISELSKMIAPDVLEAFRSADRARAANGETLELEIDNLDEAVIEKARVVDDRARIGVRYKSRVFEAVKDSEGRVISGDPTQAQTRSELWIFERRLRTRDPNWTLVGTSA